SMPLMYGDYEEKMCDEPVLIFTRSYMGETVVVGINNGDCDWPCPNGCMTIPANGYVIKNKCCNGCKE
ncbi:MAG: hypothetical protein KBS77_00170, partial [Bacteroidales bacterium]|nr:hypothetical protein [Candidatus Colicola faecequi]